MSEHRKYSMTTNTYYVETQQRACQKMTCHNVITDNTGTLFYLPLYKRKRGDDIS